MSEVIPDKPSDLAVPASTAWHAMRPGQVMSVQRTPPEGLPADDARERLLHYGRNSLPQQQKRSAWRRFLAQFENFLLQILLGAVVIMVAIGHYTDAGVVLAVVLINALMGFTQEGKAEQAIRAIQQMLSPQATVLRGGAVIMAGVLLFIILEIEKAIRYRWQREAVTATPGRAPGTGDLA